MHGNGERAKELEDDAMERVVRLLSREKVAEIMFMNI